MSIRDDFLAADKQLRSFVEPTMVAEAQKAGVDIFTDSLMYASGRGAIVANAPFKGTEQLASDVLNSGVNLMFVHFSLPEGKVLSGLNNKDIPTGFYIIRASTDFAKAKAEILTTTGTVIDEAQAEVEGLPPIVELRPGGSLSIGQNRCITVDFSGATTVEGAKLRFNIRVTLCLPRDLF